jgi:hypothetical protein
MMLATDLAHVVQQSAGAPTTDYILWLVLLTFGVAMLIVGWGVRGFQSDLKLLQRENEKLWNLVNLLQSEIIRRKD